METLDNTSTVNQASAPEAEGKLQSTVDIQSSSSQPTQALAGTTYKVSFKSSNGKYVVAENGGGREVRADRPAIGPWETFMLTDLNGGTLESGNAVNIQAANGMYMVAEGGGGGVVNANRPAAGAWERFVIKKVKGNGVIRDQDAIALQAANSQYVVAEGGGGGVVKANRPAIGPWETFTIIMAAIPGLPTSVSQATPFFKLQFRHNLYNPDGPNSSSNCGPASLAMVIKTLGLEPSGLTIENSIDHARYLMFPTDRRVTTLQNGVKVLNADGEKSSDANISTGIKTAGGTPEPGSGWDALDRALGAGKPVISYGYLGSEWRNQFYQNPNGGDPRVGSGEIDHINAILGKTPQGKYIVADPMYTGGPVEMTRDQLSKFYVRTSNGSPSFTAFRR
jgi:hypothetical protein